jgi:putative ABC transport system substrate-binding protein
MNNRRKLLVALGAGALTAPLGSFAQQQGKVWRIGFLGSESASGYAKQVEMLRLGLRELGYAEGKNIVIEFRWAEGKNDRLPDLAADLVRLNVDVIVTHGTPPTHAAKQATGTIPIVMASSGDAVATGLIASLVRPGGNITGTTFLSPELSAKRVELIKDAIPKVGRVAFLHNPSNPAMGPVLQAMEITAKALKVKLQKFEIQGANELEGVFAAMAKARVDAVILGADAILTANESAIAKLAMAKRIPSIGPREFAEAGCLLGYGNVLVEPYRRSAFFVDKILKGTKPANIPVEQPTIFELIVNLKTARVLGIKIPQTLLQRADKIIE